MKRLPPKVNTDALEHEAINLTKRFYNASYSYLQKDTDDHRNDRKLAIEMAAVIMSHYHNITPR